MIPMTLTRSAVPSLVPPPRLCPPAPFNRACWVVTWGLLRVWPLVTTEACDIPAVPSFPVWLQRLLSGHGQEASHPQPQRAKGKTCGYLETTEETSVAGARPRPVLCGGGAGLGGRRYGLEPPFLLFLIGSPLSAKRQQLRAARVLASPSIVDSLTRSTPTPLANGPHFQNTPRSPARFSPLPPS